MTHTLQDILTEQRTALLAAYKARAMADSDKRFNKADRDVRQAWRKIQEFRANIDEFGAGGWYCHQCNELYDETEQPEDGNLCSACLDANMAEIERQS
jgi:hypothetical protein